MREESEVRHEMNEWMDGELEALLRCYYSDLKTSVKNMVIAIGIATAVTLLAIPLLDEERERVM